MGSQKNWNQPWSAQEIIENAENWSLAGDVALLNTIKQFANNLLAKTDDLNKNINDLLNDLNEVGLQLDLSQNEFQSLKNTQFIESRVYDDDETEDSKENEKILESNDNQQEEKQIDINLTLEVKLLDNYFETVEISISDSEDESEKSFILKPKDVYLDRPLPPLIGSEEWYTNWYLEEEISDTDSQKSEEIYSDSDNDNNLPKDIMFASETSSEDFSHNVNENKLETTLKNGANKPESTLSSERSEGSSSLSTNVLDKMFAEQLSAKLDNVISKDERISEEINSKPIQPIKSDAFLGLFADEPPPLNDCEDKSAKRMFSNLFYEDDEENIWFEDNKKPTENKFLPRSSQVSKGLFYSDNSDDEMNFTSQSKQNLFSQSHKSIAPLIDDEPPAVDVTDNTKQTIKKKPVGGVSVFGSQNMDDILFKKKSGEKSSPASDKLKGKETEEIDTKTNNKKFNLFDKEENEDVLQKKKKISSLFYDDDDDEDESEKNDDIFRAPTKTKEKKFDLFGDDSFVDTTETKDDKNDIFNSEEKVIRSTEDSINKNKPSKTISLFYDNVDDENDLFADVTKKIDFNLFEEHENPDDLFTVGKENTIKTAHVSDNKIDKYSNKVSLFDDDLDEDDLFDSRNKNDSFKEPTTKPPIAQKPRGVEIDPVPIPDSANIETKIPSLDILPISKTKIVQDPIPVVSLFGSTPPPVDDMWDNKSDTLSDTEDFLGYRNNSGIRTSLFDNEPPSLDEEDVKDPNDTSGIDTEDLSFYPYASEKFEEQQIEGVAEDSETDVISSGKIDERNIEKSETEVGEDELSERGAEKSYKKISSITEMLKNEKAKEMGEDKVLPGKLKNNLNINVNALLPGHTQQTIKSLTKSQSLDSTRDIIRDESGSSFGNKVDDRVDLEKPLSFDETDRLEILHSITKERVRIPAKRKPSSRRGRREAIRKSALEELSSNDVLKASGDSLQPPKHEVNISDSSIVKRPIENPQFAQQDHFIDVKIASEPTIKSPIERREEYKEIGEIKRETKKNLFGSGSESDDDLFGNRNKEKKSDSKSVLKKSLFDDSSSDEDLFSGTATSRSSKSVIATKVSEKKIRPAIKKLENVKTEEDPLSNLL